METILAPLDFSVVTRAVVTQAVALARAPDGRIVLLHVLPRTSRRLDRHRVARPFRDL